MMVNKNLFIIQGYGSKWSHKALKEKYKKMGINCEALFNKLKDIVVKTCIASEPFMLDSNAKCKQSIFNNQAKLLNIKLAFLNSMALIS